MFHCPLCSLFRLLLVLGSLFVLASVQHSPKNISRVTVHEIRVPAFSIHEVENLKITSRDPSSRHPTESLNTSSITCLAICANILSPSSRLDFVAAKMAHLEPMDGSNYLKQGKKLVVVQSLRFPSAKHTHTTRSKPITYFIIIQSLFSCKKRRNDISRALMNCTIKMASVLDPRIRVSTTESKSTRSPKTKSSLKHKSRSQFQAVKESEQSLNQLLEDFEEGRLNAFGRFTSIHAPSRYNIHYLCGLQVILICFRR